MSGHARCSKCIFCIAATEVVRSPTTVLDPPLSALFPFLYQTGRTSGPPLLYHPHILDPPPHRLAAT